MSVPKASDDFHGYHSWRKSLEPLPPETVVRWIASEPYRGSLASDDIKQGQMFLLGSTRKGLFSPDATKASMVYLATQCTRTGRPYKRTWRPSVEGIAKWLEEGKLEIMTIDASDS